MCVNNTTSGHCSELKQALRDLHAGKINQATFDALYEKHLGFNTN